jgi:hypothetical protein
MYDSLKPVVLVGSLEVLFVSPSSPWLLWRAQSSVQMLSTLFYDAIHCVKISIVVYLHSLMKGVFILWEF